MGAGAGVAMRLHGRQTLVTGGTRGLGLEIARLFWSEGASLIVVARDAGELDKLGEALSAEVVPGQTFNAVLADLNSDSGLRAVVEQMQRQGGVEVLVNNAAAQGPIGKAWECDWKEWEAVIKLDFLVPVQLCRAAVPTMLRRGRGSIVNLSGGGATGPRENFSAYASAKTALVRFTETLAAEVKPGKRPCSGCHEHLHDARDGERGARAGGCRLLPCPGDHTEGQRSDCTTGGGTVLVARQRRERGTDGTAAERGVGSVAAPARAHR